MSCHPVLLGTDLVGWHMLLYRQVASAEINRGCATLEFAHSIQVQWRLIEILLASGLA